jgi:polyisoprenoid-binding protein YceI
MKNDIIKGKDFFYVEKYPSITFTSAKVIPLGDPTKFQVQGDSLCGESPNPSPSR